MSPEIQQRRTRGLFYGKYGIDPAVSVSDAGGSGITDYSKRAFLFPGQNSISAESLKRLFHASAVLQYRFSEADRALRDLGPCQSWIVRNISVFASQVGLFELLVSENVRPTLLSGHSYGEYACLVASGVLDFKDMISILVARDRACPAPGELGCLIAVRADEPCLTAMASEVGFFVANTNSPIQTVIAVKRENEPRVLAWLGKESLPFIRLEVPQPYHSPLLMESAERFQTALERLRFKMRPPSVPVLSSVLHEILDHENFSEAKVRDILARQLVEPVRFRAQIEAIAETGIVNFVEIGMRPLLQHLANDTLLVSGGTKKWKVALATEVLAPPESASPSPSPSGLAEGTLPKKILALLNNAFAVITGYEVKSIRIHDRLQEDLGIDSIKKAEIVVRVADALNGGIHLSNAIVNMGDMRTIEDILVYFDRQQRLASAPQELPGSSETDPSFRLWEPVWVAAPGEGARIEASDLRVEYRDLDSSMSHEEVAVFLDKKTNTPRIIQFVLKPAVPLTAASLRADPAQVRRWLSEFASYLVRLTRLSPGTADQGDLYFHFLYANEDAAFGKTLRSFVASCGRDWKITGFKAIEVPTRADLDDAGRLRIWLGSELMDPLHGYVRLRREGEGQAVSREVQAFQAFTDEPGGGAPEKAAPGEVTVIFGGHKGIGWEIAQDLTSGNDTSIRVALAGRTSPDDSELTRRLAHLRRNGHDVRYWSCDATQAASLRPALESIQNEFGRIDRVLSLVRGEAALESALESEAFTKHDAAVNLALLAGEFGVRQVHFFSSVFGHFGNQGQAGYALGNSCLEAVTKAFNSEGKTVFSTHLWPAWEKTGMTEDRAVQAFLDLSGFTYLKVSEGVEVYRRLARFTGPQTVLISDENTLNRLSSIMGAEKHGGWSSLCEAGSPVRSSGSALSSTTFSLEGLNTGNRSFLADHCLDGQPVLAASNMAALFRGIGQAQGIQDPELEDFVILSPAFLPKERSPFRMELRALPDRGLGLDLISSVLHARAKLLSSRNPGRKITRALPEKKYALPEGAFDRSRLRLRGRFHYPGPVWADPASGAVSIELRDPMFQPGVGMRGIDSWSYLLEAAFQAFGLALMWKLSKLALPVSVKNMTFYAGPEWTPRILAVAQPQSGKDLGSGEIYLLNEAGEVLLWLKNVNFAILESITPLTAVPINKRMT